MDRGDDEKRRKKKSGGSLSFSSSPHRALAGCSVLYYIPKAHKKMHKEEERKKNMRRDGKVFALFRQSD